MRLIRILFAALCLLYLVQPVLAESLGTRAKIKEKGRYWELDKGFSHGAKVGLEGHFLKKLQSGKGTTIQKVAHFKVVKVFKTTSEAAVLQWYEGFFPKDAQWAQFSVNLVPPAGSKEKTKPSQEKKTPPVKSKRFFLDKGSEALKSMEYERALQYYEEMLKVYPNDPGAKKGKKIAMGKSLVEKGNTSYDKGDYEDAYKAYLRAFTLLGSDDPSIAAERIIDLWDKNQDFFIKSTEYGTSVKDLLPDIIRHCSKLIDENIMGRAWRLISKIKKYAVDDELKGTVDNLLEKLINKEIPGDFEKRNFSIVLDIIAKAIEEDNFYKADSLIEKINDDLRDTEFSTRLDELKSRLSSKKEQIQLQAVIRSTGERIKELESKAKKYRQLRKYEEALQCYLDILGIEPDNNEYFKKMKEIQLEKHNYEKKQKEIKSRLTRDSHLLNAKDHFKNDLIPHALESYIKAYNALAEEGEAIAGIATILESCEPAEVKLIKSEILGKKLNIFIKDFLSHVEKTYFGSNDETGYIVLDKVFFDRQNKNYVNLLDKFKKNLYDTNIKKGDETFKKADFAESRKLYEKARYYIITQQIEDKVKVSIELIALKHLIEIRSEQRVKQIVKEELLQNKNKKDILMGLLNLSEEYVENYKFDRSKFIYKMVGYHSSVPGVAQRIEKIKKKYKEFKKKFKQRGKK